MLMIFSIIIFKFNNNTIIEGDFNSKHIFWGSEVISNNGKVVENILDNNKHMFKWWILPLSMQYNKHLLMVGSRIGLRPFGGQMWTQ